MQVHYLISHDRLGRQSSSLVGSWTLSELIRTTSSPWSSWLYRITDHADREGLVTPTPKLKLIFLIFQNKLCLDFTLRPHWERLDVQQTRCRRHGIEAQKSPVPDQKDQFNIVKSWLTQTSLKWLFNRYKDQNSIKDFSLISVLSYPHFLLSKEAMQWPRAVGKQLFWTTLWSGFTWNNLLTESESAGSGITGPNLTQTWLAYFSRSIGSEDRW